MPKNKTYKFAFGTVDKPVGSVWTIVADKKFGDIYLNNFPQFGGQLHVSLHASGIVSTRLGDDRHDMLPPHRLSGNCYCPLVVMYWPVSTPMPFDPDPKRKAVVWLGAPPNGHIMIVRFLYAPEGEVVPLENYEKLIFPTIDAKLFDIQMKLSVAAGARPMRPSEIQTVWSDKLANIEFKGPNPTAFEMLQFTKVSGVFNVISYRSHSVVNKSDN